MSKVPLEIPAGIVRKGTAYQQMGRWRDGNLIRFSQRSVVPFGGWAKITMKTPVAGQEQDFFLMGTVRSTLTWRDNLGRLWTAFGSTAGLFIYDGTYFYNISPIELVIPGEEVGAVFGYSTGRYNTENYNEPVGDDDPVGVSGTTIEYGYWHLDNWGQNLIASLGSDGKIWEWNPDTPTDLPLQIANSPEFCRGVAVTNERHMVAIGAKIEVSPGVYRPDPRRVQISNVEDNTDWSPSITSLAAELDLVTNGSAMRVFRFREETLIFTDKDVHKLVYQGYPISYGLVKIADECGLVNPGAVSKNANAVFWVGPKGFFIYDGNQVRSVQSDLFNTPADVAAALSLSGKVAVGHNSLFNEFIVLYSETINADPDSYILWNYAEGWWADGTLDRTCWDDAYLRSFPIATQTWYDENDNPFTQVYSHETGFNRPEYSGGVEFIESAPIEIGKGDQFVTIDSVWPDATLPVGTELQIGFTFRKAPDADVAPLKVVPPASFDRVRGYCDARGTGRQMEVKIQAAPTSIGGWRIGNFRLDLMPGEGR